VILVFDVGNSETTIGVFEGATVRAHWRVTTDAARTEDEVGIMLRALLAAEAIPVDSLTGSAIASVVPPVTGPLVDACVRWLDLHPIVIDGQSRLPIKLQVDEPLTVGADRIVNTLAASRLFAVDAVVVDLGTATTFDCVASDGAFVGGAIAPGIEVGLDALASRTAKLPRVELRSPDRAIGRDTASAIQSGAVLGYQALVSGLLARIRRELADAGDVSAGDVHVVLTWGLSQGAWAGALEGVEAIDPELTLKGLAILHAEVAGGQPLQLNLS